MHVRKHVDTEVDGELLPLAHDVVVMEEDIDCVLDVRRG